MKHIIGPFELTLYNGAVALIGQGINAAVLDLCSRIEVPLQQIHITLLSAAEYKLMKKSPLCDITIPSDNIYILSPAARTKGNVCYLPVLWNHADVWRKSVGLGSKSYHVTVSKSNDHLQDKSLTSHFELSGTLDKTIQEARQIGVDALDHMAVSLSSNQAFTTRVAERMITSFPTSFKGYLRFADAVAGIHPKTAALSYAQAFSYEPSLLVPISKHIGRLSASVSYGPIVTAAETERIHPALQEYLIRSWSSELDTELSYKLWTAPTMSRERNFYLGYELPRFFSWIYPSRVACMSTPRHVGDINVLIDMGFTHILTLTKESPLNPAWFYLKPLRHIYLPIRNYGAPTLEEMDAILEHICEGGTWLIHCGGGVGRAGTIAACLMAMFGRFGIVANEPQMDANTIISLLRQMRPRSLESEVQEKFVSSFVSHRWKVAHQGFRYSEPNTKLETSVTEAGRNALFKDETAIRVIFMVGKPGSGKSWLAGAIAKRRGKTIVISQDVDGRAACERALSNKHTEGTLVILDRCNSRQEDRAEWLKLVPCHISCVAVFFEYDTFLCQQRINGRLDHPTIRAGRGTNALDQMEREMEKPNLKEGFIAVLCVSSFQAAIEALVTLTKAPNLLKFPRTPHLLNTGAFGKDDIVFADFDTLSGHLTLEEKIDGANMGFSLDVYGAIQCQNRSHWVNAADHLQFKPLSKWLDLYGADLKRILHRDSQFLERYILYGEWMNAKHSIHYTNLPNHFLAFDMYDRYEGSFVSRSVLSSALRGSSIKQVPLIKEVNVVTKAEILELVQMQSVYSQENREGVYIRFENKSRTQTVGRGKVVRSDFIAGNSHWSKANLVLNEVTQV